MGCEVCAGMDVLAWVVAGPAVAGSLVLAWSGLEKIRDRAPLKEAATSLGAPAALAAIAAIVLPALELGTVVALVVGLPLDVPSALFALLGATFAAAALRSIMTGRVIACACFGASKRTLGWPQLLALPLWLLAAWSVLRLPSTSMTGRLAALACAVMLLTALRAVSALRFGLEARSDRRAFAGGA